jgi:hypothetical protein
VELSTTQEATGCAATRELPSILWNLKVYYCICTSSPLGPILSPTNPVNPPPPPPNPISPRSILILYTHLHLGLRNGLFPTNNLYTFLFSIHATCPTHLILLNLIILIIHFEEYKLRCSLLCSFLHSTVTSSLFSPNILLSTLFSNTFSLVLPICQRPSFTPIQNHRQNYGLVYSNFNVFRKSRLHP